jgi:hypothetical protein
MEKKKIISRSIESEKINIRSDEENKKRYIEGYAIVFNQRSKLIREWGETFFEIIESGAIDNVLTDPGLNVIATIDHDRAKMLGRTKSGTLELIKDERGLKYRILIPDTQLGEDIAEMVARGDYFESSFIFSIADKGVRYDNSEAIPVRYISGIATIRDVAIVVDGAYANTAVSLRSTEWETEPTSNEQPATSNQTTDILQKQIEILKFRV